MATSGEGISQRPEAIQHAADSLVDTLRHMVPVLEHVPERMLCPAAPDQTVRMGVDDVEDQRPSLELGHASAAVAVRAIAVLAVSGVRLDAARDASVVVNQ